MGLWVPDVAPAPLSSFQDRARHACLPAEMQWTPCAAPVATEAVSNVVSVSYGNHHSVQSVPAAAMISCWFSSVEADRRHPSSTPACCEPGTAVLTFVCDLQQIVYACYCLLASLLCACALGCHYRRCVMLPVVALTRLLLCSTSGAMSTLPGRPAEVAVMGSKGAVRGHLPRAQREAMRQVGVDDCTVGGRGCNHACKCMLLQEAIEGWNGDVQTYQEALPTCMCDVIIPASCS